MPSPSRAPKCPSCQREVLSPAENPCFPFCSDRCRTIDLGRWLGESYRVAVQSADEDDDGSPPTPHRVEDA